MDTNNFRSQQREANQVTQDEARKVKQEYNQHESIIPKKPTTKPEDEVKQSDKEEQ